MAFTARNEEGASAEINMTPLIDVLLVMLIIFMVITPTRRVGLEALVPQTDTGPRPAARPDPAVVLQIDAQRNLRINTHPVDWAGLGGRLVQIFKSRNERTVFVQAHSDLDFEFVARAIDIAKGAGIDNVGLLGREHALPR